jgi:hypothetical protein
MDIHLINRKLRDQYGIDVASDLPKYRIVWSDDELEKRTGLFQDFVPGTNILIRSVYEMREVKKYNYLDPQYILEKLTPNVNNPEIMFGLVYEPVWCFKEQRELIWRAIDLLIRFSQHPYKPFTEKELENMDEAQRIEDEKIMARMLDELVPNDSFHSSVKDGDTIILSDTKMWEK